MAKRRRFFKRFRKSVSRYHRKYSRRGKRSTKIFGLSLPVLAGFGAAVWYFFLRKKEAKA